MFDSSLVGVAPLHADRPHVPATYRAQFERAFALGARTAATFFMNHHPVLGVRAEPGQPQSPFPGNGGLQSVLQPLHADRAVPAAIAGH